MGREAVRTWGCEVDAGLYERISFSLFRLQLEAKVDESDFVRFSKTGSTKLSSSQLNRSISKQLSPAARPAALPPSLPWISGHFHHRRPPFHSTTDNIADVNHHSRPPLSPTTLSPQPST